MVCKGNGIPSLPPACLWSGVADVTSSCPLHQAQAQHFSPQLDHPHSAGAAGTRWGLWVTSSRFWCCSSERFMWIVSTTSVYHFSYWSGTQLWEAQDGKPIHGLAFKSVSPQLLSDCSAHLATVSFSKLVNTFCNVTPHHMKFLKCLSYSGSNASSIPITRCSFKIQLEKFCLGWNLVQVIRNHKNHSCFTKKNQ